MGENGEAGNKKQKAGPDGGYGKEKGEGHASLRSRAGLFSVVPSGGSGQGSGGYLRGFFLG